METARFIWEELSKNENGFPIRESKSVEIYVKEKSVTRAEAYEAMRAGISVKTVLSARIEDWERTRHIVDGKPEYARKVIYDGAEYDVVRTYKIGKARIEITCG